MENFINISLNLLTIIITNNYNRKCPIDYGREKNGKNPCGAQVHFKLFFMLRCGIPS